MAWKKFTQMMYDELAIAEENGWTGWDERDRFSDASLIHRARVNLQKFAWDKENEFPEHAVDVANLLMFICYRRSRGSQ